MNFKLSKYILPAVISMVVVGTNANIDGFFIGGILGDNGLAAINIVWPIVALVTSVGTGIGIAGAVLVNNLRGLGESKRAEGIKNTSVILLALVGIILGIILTLLCPTLLKLMGAKGEVFKLALDYGNVISLGAVFQIIGAGILVLLRNDGKTYQSMAYSVLGFVLHLLLNIFLAKSYGMSGVALSTVISQAVICIFGLLTLKIDKTAKPKIKYIPEIFKDTLAPFGINFVPSLVLLFTNYFALRYGGIAGVSAYAAMSYAVYTYDYIFQGVCDGIQPIISYCQGSGEKSRERHTLKSSVILLISFSVLFALLTPVLTEILPKVLKVSSEAEKMIRSGFIIYAFSYPFKAMVKLICSYYYSSGKRGLSNLLVYLDPLAFTPFFLFLMTSFFGIDGVWLSLTVTQALLFIICASTVIKKKRKAK